MTQALPGALQIRWGWKDVLQLGVVLYSEARRRSPAPQYVPDQGPLQRKAAPFKFAFLALLRPLAYDVYVQRRMGAPRRRYGRLRGKSKAVWDRSIYRRGTLMDSRQVVRVSWHRLDRPIPEGGLLMRLPGETIWPMMPSGGLLWRVSADQLASETGEPDPSRFSGPFPSGWRRR